MTDPIKRLRELLKKAGPATWYEYEGRVVANEAEIELFGAAQRALTALLDVAEAARIAQAAFAHGMTVESIAHKKLTEALANLEASHG